ncbi:hypothetical protein E1B28_003443 [Marasmius oreades]|uniref:Uncharacterized protein n=1 Tax=Marasmius oreades TaxID=181124 RepID=A0A9P7UNE9_9AGAR|nr:uncharacterized protein E1B28_003443 [Marasmius oreades]KAG7085909.1 hypothetical protein E1B28_003443 [Marasmius oreades]
MTHRSFAGLSIISPPPPAMHPRQSLQLDVGVTPHEHDPQEHTARPRGDNDSHDQLLDFDHHPSSYSSSSSINGSAVVPGLPKGLSRPLTPQEQEKLAHLDRLKFFLATAPSRWNPSQSGSNQPQHHPHTPSHPALNRFLLPSQEFVTCVYWNELYHITGTDIVRALVFRFEAFGRPVRNMKKFEEGVFSDLRNLKPGQDACLEEPKSPFLDLLFKYQCIRTQKKQKVFYWFSVPHDRLFLDALERDLKREKLGMEATTVVVGEPALSFVYDSTFKRSLYDQFVRAAGGKDGEGDLERALRGIGDIDPSSSTSTRAPTSTRAGGGGTDDEADSSGISDTEGAGTVRSGAKGKNTPFFNMMTLFEGSPTYKQRRKKTNRPSPLAVADDSHDGSSYENGGYTDDGGYLSVPMNMGIAMPTLPTSAPANFESRGGGYDRYPYDGGLRQVSSSYSPEPSVKQEPISAADMFFAQARGELHPPTRHNTLPHSLQRGPPSSSVNKRHSYAGSTATSTYDNPEGAIDPATVGVWYEGRFAGSGVGVGSARSQDPPRAHSAHGPNPHSRTIGSSDRDKDISSSSSFPRVTANRTVSSKTGKRSTAYACPLLSCSERLFKAPEHLRKHLATHASAAPGKGKEVENGERGFDSMDVGEWINNGMDEDEALCGDVDMSDIGFGDDAEALHRRNRHQGSASGVGTNLNMFGKVFGTGIGTPSDFTATSITKDGPSLHMYEVEVDGELVDVPGGEEGLVRVASSAGPGTSSRQGNTVEDERFLDTQRFSFNVPIPGRTDNERPPNYDGYGSSYESGYYSSGDQSQPAHAAHDWAHADPAYSTTSSPAIPTSSSAGYPPQQQYGAHGSSSRQNSGSRPSTGVFDVNVYNSAPSSSSAPSHKVGFESPFAYSGASAQENGSSNSYESPGIPSHTLSMDSGLASSQSLLLSSSSLNASLNGGPARRHRSMTPSLYGSHRHHGRPVSSSGYYPSGGRSSPGSVDFSIGYHPYASRSTSALSAQSSPAVGQTGLPPARSDSRASNHLMRPASSASMHSGFGDVYRSDSPKSYNGMMTDSPAAFAMDLPSMGNTNSSIFGHNVSGQPSHTMPSINGYTGNEYLGRGHLEGGYYPQHVSTM